MAMLTDVEEALVAVVELSAWLHAELALPLYLYLSLAQGVLVVAGMEGDGLALKAVGASVLLAVVAGQPHYLLLSTLGADVDVVLLAADVHKDVVLLALEQNGPFLVSSDPHAVGDTLCA